jgi:hypothetical protein
MPYVLAFSVVLNGALVYGFLRFVSTRDKAHRAEVEESRTEVRVIQADLSALVRSHAEQLERLDKAHRQEVATLCQRIQAPQVAVGEHMGQFAPPDPPSLDLDDDLGMIEERERRLDAFAQQLEDRAEELAAER